MFRDALHLFVARACLPCWEFKAVVHTTISMKGYRQGSMFDNSAYSNLSLIMNICSLCPRVREHVFAEHMFAPCSRRTYVLFVGGCLGKSIIRWTFVDAVSVLLS